jgi:hypothetical protein
MCITQILNRIFNRRHHARNQSKLSQAQIAAHEAAHGVVWYIFRKNWNLERLTIESDKLPEGISGALEVGPIFNLRSNRVDRANEIFAIALAGLIGQNMSLVLQRDNLLIDLVRAEHFRKILDVNGCGGDFAITSKFFPDLKREFNIDEYTFTKFKIMDLVNIFQNHRKVQQIHSELSSLLLIERTLGKAALELFFDRHNFAEYIVEENLDINFFHQR